MIVSFKLSEQGKESKVIFSKKVLSLFGSADVTPLALAGIEELIIPDTNLFQGQSNEF